MPILRKKWNLFLLCVLTLLSFSAENAYSVDYGVRYDATQGECTSRVQAVAECGDLQGAVLNESRLADASLAGARLIAASFKLSNLKHADLRGTNLNESHLQGADVGQVKWDEFTSWKGTRFDDLTILPFGWGRSEMEREKKALALGMRKVAPPYHFYFGLNSERWQIRQRRQVLRERISIKRSRGVTISEEVFGQVELSVDKKNEVAGDLLENSPAAERFRMDVDFFSKP